MKFNPRLSKFAKYPSAELAQRKAELKKAGIKTYDFGTGDPIEPTPQFIREALAENIPVISQYPTVRGLPEHRKAIAGYLKRRFAVELDPETEIIQNRGSKEAIYNLPFLMVDSESDKKIVIAGVPGYPVQERSTIIAGGEYFPYSLTPQNKYLLELETLSPDILNKTAVCWLNYPHNPTGASPDLAYFKRQIGVARQYNILLCSDECYVDIYSGSPPPSILQAATEGVLAFHSCSKRSGMTAYRSGFIAGDKNVLAAYAGVRETMGVATPVFTQHAAIAAWNDDEHVVERNKVFKAKWQLFADFFTKHDIEFEKSDTPFYLWIKCPGGVNGKEYATKLLEKGLIVGPGQFYGGNCVNFIRVALVPSISDCADAIEIWKSLL